MFERSWVRIPATYTGWSFFALICCKKLYCLFEKTENKMKKRPGLAQRKKLGILKNLRHFMYRGLKANPANKLYLVQILWI